MKRFRGYQAAPINHVVKLPSGAYVCRILKAEEKDGNYGSYLELMFDIEEGEYKDHFRKHYEADKRSIYGQKWRGSYRISIPDDSDDEKNQLKKRIFGATMYTVENSNSGYQWDWNPASLKGKLVGVVFQNIEGEKETGETFWYVKAAGTEDVAKVRSGKAYVAKDKPLKNRMRTDNSANGLPDELSNLPTSVTDVTDNEEFPF